MTLYDELRARGAARQPRLVHAESRGDRAIVTLADPAHLNPLSAALNLQLQDRLDEIANDPKVRAVVITGEDPAFSAGGDPSGAIGTSSSEQR